MNDIKGYPIVTKLKRKVLSTVWRNNYLCKYEVTSKPILSSVANNSSWFHFQTNVLLSNSRYNDKNDKELGKNINFQMFLNSRGFFCYDEIYQYFTWFHNFTTLFTLWDFALENTLCWTKCIFQMRQSAY